jgi:3-oxoacyl-[acyl-carrier protein] reductase
MLAQRGFSLILHGRDRARLEEARASLPEPDRHYGVSADLAVPAEIESLVAELGRGWSRLDVLVLNAGAAISAPIETTTADEWDQLFAVNARAPFLLIRALLPQLRAARGRVLVIGSVVSTDAYVNQAAYTASKHALYGFTKVMAKELHADGITVQTILPGGVATEMVRRMRPDIDPSELIQPEDVAAAASDLLDAVGNGVVDEVRIRRAGKLPWQ